MNNKNHCLWKPHVSLSLKTTNFYLQSLNIKDANKQHASWLNDKKVNAWLSSNWKNHDISTIKKFILTQDHYNTFHLGIFEAINKSHIGNFTILIDHYHKTAETRVLVGERNWWGKGVVIECRSSILEWLFNSIKVYKVYGQPSMKNIAAIFNYQKQGYECEAILKNHKTSLDKIRYDVGIFSLTKKNWEAK